MTAFDPLSGQELFDSAVAAYNAEATIPANTGKGSQLSAEFKAGVQLGLQLQKQIVYQFAVSRLATSFGADVDSFVNPYGVFRNGPILASGEITVSYPNGSQIVPVGAQTQTSTGVGFTIVADPTNSTGDFNVQLNAYVANPVATVLVQCNESGLIGNVLANTITQALGGTPPIVGSPVITNPSAFTNAIATETDQALKLRFAQYISGGSVATANAIIAATSAVQAGITFSYGDQVTYTSGTTPFFTPNQVGNFTIVANIAGQPSVAGAAALCTDIQNALMFAVKPAGIMFWVVPPIPLFVIGAGKIVVAPGYSAPTVVAAVNTAFVNYVNNIGLDQYGAQKVLAISEAYALVNSVPGVLYCTEGLTLNGVGVDILAPFGTQLMAQPGSSVFTN
jgi:hypothetical protein